MRLFTSESLGDRLGLDEMQRHRSAELMWRSCKLLATPWSSRHNGINSGDIYCGHHDLHQEAHPYLYMILITVVRCSGYGFFERLSSVQARIPKYRHLPSPAPLCQIIRKAGQLTQGSPTTPGDTIPQLR